MRITVLGGCGAWPEAGQACSEASYVDRVPEDAREFLSSARRAGRQAAEADVGRLLLTHLLPGTRTDTASDAAAEAYTGEVGVATAGLVVDLS